MSSLPRLVTAPILALALVVTVVTTFVEGVAEALTDTGVVVYVEDGDTFTVRYPSGVEERIRVAGINTNETNRSPSCLATEATSRLSDLVMGKSVVLQANSASSMAEGRPIRHVFVNGVNVAHQMLLEGYGVPLIFMNEPSYALDYLRAFRVAEAARRGVNDPDACGSGYAIPDVDMIVSSDADGSDFENVNGEWVMIRNRGSSTLNLTGWQLHDTALEYYAFPSGTSIAPGGWLKVHVGTGVNSSNRQFMGRTYPIFSGADGAFLLDPKGNIRKKSLWPCLGLCGDEPVPSVTITDVQYDVPGIDAPNDEWIRIKNTGETAIDLLDWNVHSYPHNVFISASTPVQPGASITVFVGKGSNSATKVYMQKENSILDANGDVVLLASPAGDVASCVAWGSATCRRHPSKGRQGRDDADFDGDGWGDVVIGVPGESIASYAAAGAVNVEYGAGASIETAGGNNWQVSSGFSATFSQAGPVSGAAEPNDRFGAAVGTGDFDGDGYDDVIIGVPGEQLGGSANAGVVNVLYGSRLGLTSARNQMWSQSGAIAGFPETGDAFGSAVVGGDFDGDGFSDVAVGVPGENGSSGMVNVLFGSPGGLTGAGNQAISQAGTIEGAPEPGDRFGGSLASGDFDGDGYDDLAVGVPGEDGGAGAVNIVFGGPSGLTTSGNELLGQWGAIPGASEPGDRFGAALAAGDLDGDGRADLAIGSPGEAMYGRQAAGSVHVLFGSADGIDRARAEALSQSANIGGSSEAGDEFGSAVLLADLDADGFSDLVIGVPGEGLGSTTDTGVVHVVPGGAGGLSPTAATLSQSGAAIIGASERGDRFGSSLAVVDHDGFGSQELVIGIPGEDVGSIVDAGSAAIVWTSLGGTATGSIGLTQWGARAGAGESGDAYGDVVGARR